jgi:hypothetical protein
MAEYVDLKMFIFRELVHLEIGDASYDNEDGIGMETLERLEGLRSAECSWEEYGKELFQATFRGRALDGYRRVRDAVNSGQQRFRVRLNIHAGAAELHPLVWECLWDSEPPPCRLGCSLSTPLSRYLSRGVTRQPVTDDTLKVLVAISNPVDLGQEGGKWSHLPPLDEAKERAVIANALKDLEYDRVTVEFQDKPASLAKIRQRLAEEGFHVLHVVSHGGFLKNGEEKGYLLLERDKDETVHAVGEKDLADMVADLRKLRLVVLAACFGARRSETDAFIGLAPRMVEYGVPAVVAMRDRVATETAQIFTEVFYGALLKSPETRGMVDLAMNAARDQLFFRLRREAPWDWTIPALFMHGDGKLFEPAPVGAARDAAVSRVVERTQQTEAWLQQLPEVRARLIPEVARLSEQGLYRLQEVRRSQERLLRGAGPAPEPSLWQELGMAKLQPARHEVRPFTKGFGK